jgi:hypothetical protein
MTPELAMLGDTLEKAFANDIAGRRRARRTRGLLLAAAVLAITVPGLSFAASALISNEEVAASLPAGTRMLQGTDPRCSVVVQDVEYRCELARPPESEIAGDLTGTVEPTVDATKHVNGGCRALDAKGLEWRCYIGRAAVDQQIIGPDFLGEYAPAPGVG